MLNVVTGQRKQVYTILALTKIHLKSLLLFSREHNSDTALVHCCFSFGQVALTVVTPNYYKHTCLAVILEDLQNKSPLLLAMIFTFQGPLGPLQHSQWETVTVTNFQQFTSPSLILDQQ